MDGLVIGIGFCLPDDHRSNGNAFRGIISQVLLIMTNYIPIGIIGISHKTAPVEIRDKVVLTEEDQFRVLKEYREKVDADGLLAITTCNRTEIYISGENFHDNLDQIRILLNQLKKCSYFTDEKLTYKHIGFDAVTHFFRLISGMDSQIIGEPQITGQVKEAYCRAFELKATDTIINKMFEYGLHAEKIIRTDTYLSDGAVSVSFAGVELARQIFSDFNNKTALLIGAGETVELAARHFIDKGIQNIRIANRTASRAQELAKKLNGQAFAFTHLEEAFNNVDIIISATASDAYIITKEILKPICESRNYRPLFMIDLAMPRDIDPEVETLDGVYLYNLDHLNNIVALNLEKRKNELPKAEKIINESLEDFRKWNASHSMGAVIGRLKKHFENLRDDEFKRLKNKLPDNGKAEIEYLTQSIINKLIHQHIKTLKKSASNPERYQEQVDFLFDLYDIDKD
ncbi:MAG: glutamyl-tRNA reductase [Calditrichaceae bacterium]|nr:glutamyl-tRNA reductase [Calditrichaceae bacterium]MBN2709663.1 glutamyl-tRNA reductase [Calditrichaceae bacterium]